MSAKQKPLTIFLAIDGSEHSRVATEILCSLPLPKDSSIIALAVLDTPHTPRRQLLLAALSQTQEYIEKHGLSSEIGLLHGRPAEALTSYADDHHPDLIVMGAKGLRATLGILLGGVAQQIIEYSNWPVFICRPPFKPIKQVLAITDGSTYSRQSLEFLSIFPLLTDTNIHLVYVVPPMPEYPIGSFSHTILSGADVLNPIPSELLAEIDNWQEQAEETGKNLLAEGKDILGRFQGNVNSKLLHGDAATEILKFSKEIGGDLIVAGSRGMNPVKSWLLGSVSRKLVHYADCSVMVVRSGPA